MLHKCANTACAIPFRRLSEGKLFQVESVQPNGLTAARLTSRKVRSLRRVEHFWLCNDCCGHLTLVYDKSRGIIAVPIPLSTPRKPASSITPSNSRAWHEVRAVR